LVQRAANSRTFEKPPRKGGFFVSGEETTTRHQ